MNNDELMECAQQARAALGKDRGALHTICDAEAHAKGELALLKRESVEAFFRHLIREGKIRGRRGDSRETTGTIR